MEIGFEMFLMKHEMLNSIFGEKKKKNLLNYYIPIAGFSDVTEAISEVLLRRSI